MANLALHNLWTVPKEIIHMYQDVKNTNKRGHKELICIIQYRRHVILNSFCPSSLHLPFVKNFLTLAIEFLALPLILLDRDNRK